METQVHIADKSDLSPSALGMILTGKRRPSWAVAKRLAAATGIDPADWLELPADQLRQKLGLKPRRPYRRKKTAALTQEGQAPAKMVM